MDQRRVHGIDCRFLVVMCRKSGAKDRCWYEQVEERTAAALFCLFQYWLGLRSGVKSRLGMMASYVS